MKARLWSLWLSMICGGVLLILMVSPLQAGNGGPPRPFENEPYDGAEMPLGSVAEVTGPATMLGGGRVEVSQPKQLTRDDHYERGEAIVFDGSQYWLFYGRSESVTESYETGNPDIYDYRLYYQHASSVAALGAATPTLLFGVAHNANGYMGETGAAYLDGEVWAFATVVSGTSAELYGWYTGDGGTTWQEVGPILSGLSRGQAHHDEIAFDGEIWVVEGSGDFTTMHSATPKSGGWSSPLTVDPALTGGLAHFYAEAGTLYLALYSNGRNAIYRYDGDTTSWVEVDSITPPEKYDPTLFKVGGTYLFAQAPWDGVRQFIIAWHNDTLDSTFFDDPYRRITEGGYGDNPWVDMWPIGFTSADGTSYLFFTSERNPDDPATEVAGNIWVLEVNWELVHDHCTYIQEAVREVSDGETVAVAPGTYVEQLEITKSLVLSGTGIGETIIQSPYTLSLKFTTSADNYPIVYVHDITETTIQDLTVDGASRGNANYRFAGIAFRNAGGTVDRVEIIDVRDTPFRGAQHGVALYVLNTDGVTRSIQVYDSYFSGFQKNAMALNALNSVFTVDVRGNTIVGQGATTVTAQNGIQVWANEGMGTVANNAIRGIAYDNTDDATKWVATSILNYYADLVITDNIISDTHMGIYNYDGSAWMEGNRITIKKVGVEAWGIVASDPPAARPSPFIGMPSLDVQMMSPQAPAARRLAVEVYSNTLAFTGTVHSATHGLEVDSGYGDAPLAFTATHNLVQGFGDGMKVWRCEEGCGSGDFALLVIDRNCFLGNGYGMTTNLTTTIVQAEGNYWGAISGPYHPVLNPQGEGDAAGDGIDFDPWALVCGGGAARWRCYLPLLLRGG